MFNFLSPCLFSSSALLLSTLLRHSIVRCNMCNRHCVDVMLLCLTASERTFMNEKLGVNCMSADEMNRQCVKRNALARIIRTHLDVHCHATAIVWEFFTGGAMLFFTCCFWSVSLPSYTHLSFPVYFVYYLATSSLCMMMATSAAVMMITNMNDLSKQLQFMKKFQRKTYYKCVNSHNLNTFNGIFYSMNFNN